MSETITVAEMRALERRAIESGAVTGQELMERAGRGVVAAMFTTWPDLGDAERRAVVLCGPGNNGGDGFVVARLLAARGLKITTVLCGDPARLPPDARGNYDALSTKISRFDAARPFLDPLPDIVIDAVFGIGLARPIEGPLAALLKSLSDTPQTLRTVAIDIPSGLDAETGQILGHAMPCDLTVTFHQPKPGHLIGEGPAYCGKLVVEDIGLHPFNVPQICPPEA
ncbi:NAD(P)H-hydrate epimerase [Sulfitobacter aestuariivivens]|uniref:NAD(P)H-hydrate epimerase n=1 Tax=Sulfitobacter aestuariivivens TaxID=2766981 RepID=A0A927D3J6_9RHOB|nr:NAD(P)H-hydrate epimerase [Sulfitobacter aestuariivivens]